MLYEQNVFAESMRISQIRFEQFVKRLEHILPVTPDMFSEVQRVSRSTIALPDRKRKQGAQSVLGTLDLTYQAIEK